MGPSPWRVWGCPGLPLMLLALLSSPMSISGTSGMNSSPMSTNSLSEGIHALSTHINTLISQCKFPHPLKPRKCWKSWSCNMPCDTMRPVTGSSSRTSPSSPTSPFMPTANCFSHDASSTKRPRRRDELTSLPLLQWPLQHLPSTLMPSLPIPSAISVATPTPRQMPS